MPSRPKPAVPPSTSAHRHDATAVDPRPDARARLQQDRAQVDFGDDNLLFSHIDSAAVPLDLGVDIGLDLVLDAAPSGKLSHNSHVGRYRLRERLGEGRRIFRSRRTALSRARRFCRTATDTFPRRSKKINSPS